MSGISMYKTKLCILFKKNGQCSRPNCSFAHGTAELRRPGESSFTGRHPLDSDLRDKIGRRLSPERRPSSDRGGPSSDRSGRRLPRFSGHENSRPFEKRIDKDYRENYKFDERSDYAGGLKVGTRVEDRVEDERKKFPGHNGALEEQLKDIELDIKMLSDDKLRLGASFERKAQEVDILTSRIQELETQLDREREECRSVTSSIKKFVKEYNRFLRAQDDVKRSQARLQKLGSQFTMYLIGNEGNDRDADVDIMSDEENNARNLRPPNEFQNSSFLSRKRHHVDQYTTRVPSEDAMIGRGEGDKLDSGKKPSRWNRVSSKSYSEEEGGGWNDDTINNHPSSREDKWKRRRFSSGNNPATDKGSGLVMSSTSMAAQADDEVAEIDEEEEEEEEEAVVKPDDTSEAKGGSPFTSLPPPPLSRDAHFQGDEDENDGDMEETKTDNVDSI